MREVYFYSCPELIIKLQSVSRKDDECIDDVLNTICKKDVIVLDDLGAEKMTDFVRQCLYMIINHREQNMLDTVITSNFTLDQIANQIDVRIASRIAGLCKVIKLSGNDKRITIKNEDIKKECQEAYTNKLKLNEWDLYGKGKIIC